ncbi:MAG: LysE family translocator [Candidatus Adiutrix sp.]|jgi:threonine/homoserine/homoserine lactone efflux protein|nr:LysE family translocator [Candidatus Adiutrix sp.]
MLIYIDLQSFILPLAFYLLFMALTPGPNNTLLLAAGANFSPRRLLPQIMGILAGDTAIVFISGLGLGVLFETAPFAQWTLKIAGTIFIGYLAVKLLADDPAGSSSPNGRPTAPGKDLKPMSFPVSAAIQFVNIKLWAATMAGIAAYVPEGPGYWPRLCAYALLVVLTVAPSCLVWGLGGAFIKKWSPGSIKLVNRTLAVLLLLSIAGFYIY